MRKLKSKIISERLRQEIISGKFDADGKLLGDRMLMRLAAGSGPVREVLLATTIFVRKSTGKKNG